MTHPHPTTSLLARLWLLAEPWLVLALVLYLVAS